MCSADGAKYEGAFIQGALILGQGVFILFPLVANVLIIELERWVEDMLQRQLSVMEQENIYARDLSTCQKRHCKSVQW